MHSPTMRSGGVGVEEEPSLLSCASAPFSASLAISAVRFDGALTSRGETSETDRYAR